MLVLMPHWHVTLAHQLQPINQGFKKLVLGWLMTLSDSFKLLKGRNNVNSACKFFLLFQLNIFEEFYRALQKDDGTIKVHLYCATTATGSLRGHLLKHHAEEWVKECQSLKIGLRGKEGGVAMARVTGVPTEHQAVARIAFTQEKFLDGLVQFIVVTDQVFLFLLSFSFVNFFSRL